MRNSSMFAKHNDLLGPRDRIARSSAALPMLWAVAAAAMGAWLGLAQPPLALGLAAGIASIAFIGMLVRHLSHSPPAASALPDLAPLILPRLSFWRMLLVIIAALAALCVIGIAQHPWVILLLAATLISLRLMLAWRSRLTRRLVALGLAAGALAAVANIPVTQSGLAGVLFTLVTTPLIFIGGGLLLEHTGLAHVRLLEGQYTRGFKSFAWACVLALPAALLNIFGGANASDAWVSRWWHPLAAFAPGIAEEIAARLFLTTLCYALLRPTTNEHPRRAIVAAILLGAIVHSLAHLPTLSMLSPQGFSFLIVGLLYGVPLALLFVKRDLEQAIGYHFFIDFIRFVAALIWL